MNIINKIQPNNTYFDQIKDLIKNELGGSLLMTVTPSVAEFMLKFNTKNRPQRTSRLFLYAAEMSNGRWMQTGQPIVFSKTGRIIDGQHRLESVIRSGVTLQFYCQFGIKDEAYKFTDGGAPRDAADLFSVEGVLNGKLMSGAVRWIWSYENNKVPSAGSGNSTTCTLLADQLYEYYLKKPKLSESGTSGTRFKNSGLASKTVMTAMHYICACKNRAAADDFFEEVATGIGFTSSGTPAYQLNRILIKNAIADFNKLRPAEVAILTLRAWNAMRLGRKKFDVKIQSLTLPRVK